MKEASPKAPAAKQNIVEELNRVTQRIEELAEELMKQKSINHHRSTPRKPGRILRLVPPTTTDEKGA